MCQKHDPRKIDKCMRKLITNLSIMMGESHWKPVACCCGHGRYPMTIVMEGSLYHIEIFSGIKIERERRFYKKDRQGFYFIPEVSKEKA